MKKVYNKLIRDRIPEIIIADGAEPKVRVLKKTEMFLESKKKILEEAKELIGAEKKSEVANELADILELVETIAENKKIDLKILKSEQKSKRQKRGGFKKRLFLEYVLEPKAKVKNS